MRRSTSKILTTHIGALPELTPLDRAAPDYEAQLKREVAAVVAKQREIGLDIINEGESTKGGDWLSYVENRFGGFEERPPAGDAADRAGQGPRGIRRLLSIRHRARHAVLHAGAAARQHGPPDLGLHRPGDLSARRRRREREMALLKALVPAEDAFLTSTAPASLEVYRRNEYYKNDEEYVFAIADAMRVEYETIAKSGVRCRSTTPGCRRCGTASASRWDWRRSAAAAKSASRR